VIRALAPLHNVDVLVSRDGDQAYVERQGAVRILRVPRQEQTFLTQVKSFQRALHRQLEGSDYDVVHCLDPWAAEVALEARARLGFAVVHDLSRVGERVDRTDLEVEAALAQAEDLALRRADLVLLPTEHALRHAHSRGRAENVMLAPPGVDVDRFDWDEVSNSERPRILFAGAIAPGRGVRILVRAMLEVVKQVPAELVLAGPCAPGFEGQLRTAIADVGIPEQAQIVGAVDHEQMPPLIATATVCVAPWAPDPVPSPFSPFPTKILEFLACRRAVVAPDVSSVRQVIEDGYSGLLFDPGDPLDLAAKITKLIEQRSLRERLAQAGYDRVRRDFTASAARRLIRAAYSELSKRFAARFPVTVSPTEDERAPEPLADDDFEATIFEEGPPVVAVAAAETGPSHRVAGDGQVVSARELMTVALGDLRQELAHQRQALSSRPSSGAAGASAWIPSPETMTEIDEGTPIDGLIPPPPPPGPPSFVSGEIDGRRDGDTTETSGARPLPVETDTAV
jgi:glycosyltransferase involved in cell wall biosynthesis